MTREQAEQEFRKLLDEWNDEEEKIMQQAKRDGTWMPGLDSDRDLFVDTKKKYLDKIKQLRESVDE